MNYKILIAAYITVLMTCLPTQATPITQESTLSTLSCETPQQEVEDFLATHEVDKIVSYCQVGKFNCRSLVFYKNSTTGDPVKTFEDRFLTSEKNSNLTASSRSVASRAFFLEQHNGTFNLYLQESYKNEVEITQVLQENQNIQVQFDEEGFPSFAIHFLVLGTTDTIEARASFGTHWATISNKSVEPDPAKTFTLKFILKP